MTNDQDQPSRAEGGAEPVDLSQNVAAWLHDYPVQTVMAARLKIHRLRSQGLTAEIADELAAVEALLEQAGKQIRDVMHARQPEANAEQSLLDAMRSVIDEVNAMYGIACPIDRPAELRLPQDDQAIVVRCLREGLINAARHTQATQAHAEVVQEDAGIKLTLKANGDAAASDPLQGDGGEGLEILTELARSRGGQLRLDLNPIGDIASTLVLSLPFSKPTG